MELLVAADSHFYKTPDGKYWCRTIYSYDFWLRYLSVYEKISVVSRTKQVKYTEVEGFLRVDGPGVSIKELPFMRGMKEYIRNYFAFCKAAKDAVQGSDLALFRLPSVSAFMVLKYFKQINKNKPYALEIVADPYDAYRSNKAVQLFYTKKLRKVAMEANGVSYVTKHYLQDKYPSYSRKTNEKNDQYFESYYSTIDLSKSYFANPRIYKSNKKRFTIVHTANSINSTSKAHEPVLTIVKKLRDR